MHSVELNIEKETTGSRGRPKAASQARTKRPEDLTVSVILPTFNRASFLSKSIQSILQQSLSPREVVVVDDGSSDATAAVVAEFGPCVTYIKQSNAGKLAAIERGLDHVHGDLVWIMDDDDLADPHALEALRQPFIGDPDCVMSYGRMSRFEDGEEADDHDIDVRYPAKDDRPFLAQLMEDCFITGHPCTLTRRSALDDMRPFRDDLIASVDYYLYLGVAQSGATAFVDRHVLRQRQHQGARGAAAHRYSEADRTRRWVDQDKKLIAPLLDELPIRAYVQEPQEPSFSDPELFGLADRRRALLQKGVIAARKKLWARAFVAFRQALNINCNERLDSEELMIVERALGCRYGINEVYDNPAIPAALRRIAGRRSDSTPFLVALSRPLLHEIKIALRERDLSRAQAALLTWQRLMPARASLAAATKIVRRNIKRSRRRPGQDEAEAGPGRRQDA